MEQAGGSTAPDDPLFVPRLMATTSYVLFASGLRTAGRWSELCVRRSQELTKLAIGSMAGEDGARVSQAQLRDEVLGLVREMAEVSWQEARRAIDQLDEQTRHALGSETGPARPYRVKS